jgi:iron complex transport system substrate-binding protein
MIRKLYLIAILFHLLITSSLEAKEHIYTDEIGRKVKIPDVPKRIVSLAPSITEILFALGLNEEIVGVTHFCDYPEAALEKPKIGGFINPSIEKIVSIKPDLIIGTRDGNPMETIDRLSGLGFSVILTDSKGFDGVIRTISNIGEIVGRQYESRRITGDMIRRKEHILAHTRSLPKPKVFFQVGYVSIITVGRGTLGDDLIRLAGGKSISEHESLNYPIYSIEAIILKAPEIIIMSSMENNRFRLNLVKTWQKWKNIPAVKMNAIYVIDSNLVDRPSPRIIEGLEAMAKMIHPKDLGWM